MPTAAALAPLGISSFFAICDTDEHGRPLADPLRIGAIGGGFKALPAVRTEVLAEPSERTEVRVFINGREEEACTSRFLASRLVEIKGGGWRIIIHHRIPAPIASGFGTSGAGALSLAVALAAALGLRLSTIRLAQLAHEAEVRCRTGLGTVGGLLAPGACVITRKPGAPGIGLVDSIPVDEDKFQLVVVHFGEIPTRRALADPGLRSRVNALGWRTLERIMEEPSLERFLEESWRFAEEAGFVTSRLREAARLLDKAGAVGYAQNMLGEALHAVLEKDAAEEAARLLEERFKEARVLVLRLTSMCVKLCPPQPQSLQSSPS